MGTARLIVVSCVALTMAACGGGPTGAASSDSPATVSASPSGDSISEDLTFTGSLAGHMSTGMRGDTYVCASTGGSYVAGPIVGDVGGKQVALNITKISFHGSGSYPAGGVSFDVNGGHYYPALNNAGTLVVASDLRSGTVDIALAANEDPSTIVGHVTGTWRCPPDAF
jgi:hypothetical protein